MIFVVAHAREQPSTSGLGAWCLLIDYSLRLSTRYVASCIDQLIDYSLRLSTRNPHALVLSIACPPIPVLGSNRQALPPIALGSGHPTKPQRLQLAQIARIVPSRILEVSGEDLMEQCERNAIRLVYRQDLF